MAPRKKEIATPDTPSVDLNPPLDVKPSDATPAAPILYISKNLRMFHPDQQKYLLPGEPVELEMDSWLQSQVDAGLVSVLGS